MYLRKYGHYQYHTSCSKFCTQDVDSWEECCSQLTMKKMFHYSLSIQAVP